MLDRIKTDVAVIGAGCAGLRAALAAAEAGCSVTVLSKGPVNRSGITAMSSEGFQAPFAAGDSPEVHFKDTLEAGAGGVWKCDLSFALDGADVKTVMREVKVQGAKVEFTYDFDVQGVTLRSHVVGEWKGTAFSGRYDTLRKAGAAARESLIAFAERLAPKKVLLVHGDPPAVEWVRARLMVDLPDSEIVVPTPGVEMEL